MSRAPQAIPNPTEAGDASGRLRHLIERERARLRASLPAACPAALLALIGAGDRLSRQAGDAPATESERRLANLGGALALRDCLSTGGGQEAAHAPAGDTVHDRWAEDALLDYGRLAEAEIVVAQVDAGLMRLVAAEDRFDAWVATKRGLAHQRERADFDWWAASFRAATPLALNDPRASGPAQMSGATSAQTVARSFLAATEYQLDYPPDATIGGCPVRLYCAVLIWLIADALTARDRRQPPIYSQAALVDTIAADLAVDRSTVARALDGFTLDAANAAVHAAVPGVGAAPLVRLDGERVATSWHGLTTEPWFFLARELRRRDAAAHHNSAFLREDVFRHGLYALFADNRFVTSPGQIKLRREGGNVRTDIDAVVFDRKTGTIGLFELKSQEPFARLVPDPVRQREAVIATNHQIAGAMAWLKQHGGDALLDRFDRRTGKTFKVSKVYPFVLGRSVGHFSDSPEPDRRAAWSSWPRLLRLLDRQPLRLTDANPLTSLYSRLRTDAASPAATDPDPPREIVFGGVTLVVHPSPEAYQAARQTRGDRLGGE